jgi:hypothetical protein
LSSPNSPLPAADEDIAWKSPWLWGSVGAVVVAGAVAAFFLWPRDSSTSGDLGIIDVRP